MDFFFAIPSFCVLGMSGSHTLNGLPEVNSHPTSMRSRAAEEWKNLPILLKFSCWWTKATAVVNAGYYARIRKPQLRIRRKLSGTEENTCWNGKGPS